MTSPTNPPSLPPTGWQRHCVEPSTDQQRIVDGLFGLLLPLLCFLLAGVVHQETILGTWRLACYISFAIASAALIMVHARATRPSRSLLVCAGILCTGALASTLVGILVLPFSLSLLPLGIGVLGFTPFVTALVLARAGLRALRGALPYRAPAHRLIGLLSGVLLVVVPTLGIHTWANATWPEVPTIPIYPGATRRSMEAFALTDSGLAMAQTHTFATTASAEAVEQFYDHQLQQQGWRADRRGDWSYTAATGRTYSVVVRTFPNAAGTLHVEVILKYSRI